jgi:uncharacterized integral membrane protein
MSNTLNLDAPNPVYQGQFGEFSITSDDRKGVKLYRGALLTAALCCAIGTALTVAVTPVPFGWVTAAYAGFSVALGVALWMIHIYMKALHRALQAFWAIGTVVSVGLAAIALSQHQSLALYVAQHPLSIFGIGFTFVSLTGIFFKEAFCFNRLETKLLVAIVPTLLLGHLFGLLPVAGETVLLEGWAVLFLIFAARKCVQNIPDDIGDKSVFDYLEREAQQKKETANGTAA